MLSSLLENFSKFLFYFYFPSCNKEHHCKPSGPLIPSELLKSDLIDFTQYLVIFSLLLLRNKSPHLIYVKMVDHKNTCQIFASSEALGS